MSKAPPEVPAGEGLGLLGGIDPIDSEVSNLRERIKALFIRMSLDQRERALNRNPFFGNSRLSNEISFERRLLDFATRNGITLLDPTDWRLPALIVAAKEHKELVPPVKRGRPATLGGIGLLADRPDKKRAHRDAAAYSAMVGEIMQIEGISQRRACHRLAAELFPTYSGLSLDSKAKQIENHVSAHNANRGERRKPGRAKRTEGM